jgi:phosphoribosyl-dephospho-CoA transferase
MTTATLPVIDLGTLDRDLTTGQFVTTYTLRYTTVRSGAETVIQRTLPAASIERIGVVTARCADRGVVWDIEVIDKDGNDVTFDFACFQGATEV